MIVILKLRYTELPQVRDISNDEWRNLGFVEVPELQLQRSESGVLNIVSGEQDVITLVQDVKLASCHDQGIPNKR